MKHILELITQLILYQTYKNFGKSYLEIRNSEFSYSFSYDLVLMRRFILCILYLCLV
jgi:phosphopantetheinyl transferase